MKEKSLSPINSNISFSKYLDMKIVGVEKIKITFDYITINNCKIENSNFANCDFLGSRIYNNTLRNVRLNNADIISDEIISCTFINVSFDGACIEDITFKDCIFDNCSFKNLSMKNCTYQDCSFIKFSPESALIELNIYNNCSFTYSKFDSSFHYQIFDDCLFDNVLINPELLGFNFGLFINTQVGLSLIDNSISEFAQGDIILELKDSFINRYLYINAMILMLNADTDSNQSLFLNWANTLKKTIEHNNIIKSSEITFIKNVIINMFNKKHIAPIIVFNLYSQLINIYKNCQCANKLQDSLLVLINSLYKEIQIYINKLLLAVDKLPSYNGRIELFVKYNSKPTIALCDLLNEFKMGVCVQTKTQKGSFLEWIESPDNIISCLNILISLLGITVPIIYSHIKDKRKKQNRESIVPQELFSNNTNIVINVNIQNGCQIINNYNLVENGFCGYTNENIKSITIIPKK